MKNTEKHTTINQSRSHNEIDNSVDTIINELQKEQKLEIKLSNVLRMLVQKTGSTSGAIFQVLEGHVLPRNYKWPLNAGAASNGFHLERRLSLEALGLASFEDTLSAGKCIAGNTTDFKGKERDFIQRDQGKSFIIVPIMIREKDWWGFMELSNSREEKKWTPEQKDLLSEVADEVGKIIFDEEINASKNMSNTDLIELRLREELLSAELDEINRWKNQILSAFSHEFQTPLYTLLGFSKTLIENEELDDDKEIRMTCLHHIYEQSRRLEKLVNNLMFASRLHTKSIHVEKHLVDFRAVTHTVRKWAESKAKEAKLEFYIELPQQPIQITCDPAKIEKMLQNILENAIMNTPAPGWVSMKVIPEPQHVIVIVADTGTGIQKDKINRIFEPFFSAATTQTSEQGVGLGLSIAKEIVDLHNGFITVESKEGEGSVFTITLPRSNDESVRALQ